jgi:hypothetical protein
MFSAGMKVQLTKSHRCLARTMILAQSMKVLEGSVQTFRHFNSNLRAMGNHSRFTRQ